ncbi:hypothetical protein CR513_11542, partial [Mucuna pruriens]
MDAKIEAIEKNDTWKLTSLLVRAKKVGVKWVYKTKANENGEIEKYKAYLVVPKSMALITLKVLNEEVYIEQPPGYEKKGAEQNRYAQEVLERFDMNKCNSVNNPIVPSCKLARDENGARVDNRRYKQLTNSLMYLTATRSNMMCAVSLLSKYMEHPTELYFQAAKKVRYIKRTFGFGIFYKKGGNEELTTYTDSDYARDLDDRRNGVVTLVHCHSQEQIADIMTKSLKLDLFVKFRSLMGVCVDPNINRIA